MDAPEGYADRRKPHDNYDVVGTELFQGHGGLPGEWTG